MQKWMYRYPPSVICLHARVRVVCRPLPSGVRVLLHADVRRLLLILDGHHATNYGVRTVVRSTRLVG